MRVLRHGIVAVAQGDADLFSDFEDDGPMWAGEGDRSARRTVSFDRPFLAPPSVQAWVTLWDAAADCNARFDIRVEEVTPESATLALHTWGDSRIARVRLSWLAIGEVENEERWDIP